MKHSDQAACDCHRCNMHDRPTGHAEQHRRGQQPARPVFDYDRQAWIDADGRYLRCGHPEAIDCRCWGRLHEGERAADHQPATDQPDPTRTEATQPYRTTRAAQQIARDLDHQAMTTPYRCATCRTPHARQLEADLCCPANELSQGESIDVLARELGRRLGGILWESAWSTADPVQAITDAMSYSTTTSTIPIARIVIDLDLDQTEKE